MATLLTSVRRKFYSTFGDNALYWYHRSYALDWCVCSKLCLLNHRVLGVLTLLPLHRFVATAAWVMAWWIKVLPPYERDFSVDDVLINHAHRKNQYVCVDWKHSNDLTRLGGPE